MRDLKIQNQRLHEELERAAGQHATAAADAAGALCCNQHQPHLQFQRCGRSPGLRSGILPGEQLVQTIHAIHDQICRAVELLLPVHLCLLRIRYQILVVGLADVKMHVYMLSLGCKVSVNHLHASSHNSSAVLMLTRVSSPLLAL